MIRAVKQIDGGFFCLTLYTNFSIISFCYLLSGSKCIPYIPCILPLYILIFLYYHSVINAFDVLSGSKCVIRVIGGVPPSNNVFFIVKRIIKIPLPLKFILKLL